jgi:NAD(P)-dependent dehydrogenase (short-subunit alcohol dehydrogenase family)
VRQVRERFGRIDALVNNAGVAPLIPFGEMTDAIWDEVIATNLTSTYRFTRAVWPAMVGQKSGVIVNVSSEASRDPFPGFTAYAAAKAGVNLFTKALATEGDAVGIRVHAVAPAGVETAMLRKLMTPDQLPSDQLLKPEDVAAAIRGCVCGDMASTSGETIFVHRRV